jgi:hypothetical protein
VVYLENGPGGSHRVTIGWPAALMAAIWSHYLVDACVSSIDIAPDGTVWLQTRSSFRKAGDFVGVDTYVISSAG